jgi:hypothetical protein
MPSRSPASPGFLFLAFTLTATAVPQRAPALSCISPDTSPSFSARGEPGDAVPPSAPTVTNVVFLAGAPRESSGCGGGPDCPSIDQVSMTVTASDDKAEPQALGYRVRLVRGDDRLYLPYDARAPQNGELRFGGYHTDESHGELVLAVSAVDQARNEGPATEVTVRY